MSRPWPVLSLLITRYALSISPAHLLLPVTELQLETWVTDRWSVTAIAGAGVISAGDLGTRYLVLELGGQVRHYWAGLHVGLEVLATRADGRGEGGLLMADGLGAGGLVGYQWVLDQFLIEVGGGLGVRYRRSEARDLTGDLAQAGWGLWPILNLNLGRVF